MKKLFFVIMTMSQVIFINSMPPKRIPEETNKKELRLRLERKIEERRFHRKPGVARVARTKGTLTSLSETMAFVAGEKASLDLMRFTELKCLIEQLHANNSQ